MKQVSDPSAALKLPTLLDIRPAVTPPLDAGFRPPVLALRQYRRAVEQAGGGLPLVIGIERENGLLSRFETRVLAPDGKSDGATLYLVERLIKFLLWSRGGWKIHFGGPRAIGEYIRDCYGAGGLRAFDARVMGDDVYGKTFVVDLCVADDVPPAREMGAALGGHLDGCRVGFDLGASDYKIAAVRDGDVVFTEEIPWNPKDEPDPEYHYRHVREGLRKAAAHLPRVDAIGGSSAGIYINNQVKIASLFRSVPKDLFDRKVKNMFLDLQREWGVPLEVINDGEVTALAGTMSLGSTAMLGVAMGSSQAGGFLNREGHLPGWLDELAFTPVDFNPRAAGDEWSGDRGVGALYFSQQAVNKLAPAAGYSFPETAGLPERLKEIQAKAEAGEAGARRIFETIGVYLGYTIPLYAEFYDYDHLLILGRVTSGRGGDLILEKAQSVFKSEFPELAERIEVNVLDEEHRRVGQAVAAASLPELKKGEK